MATIAMTKTARGVGQETALAVATIARVVMKRASIAARIKERTLPDSNVRTTIICCKKHILAIMLRRPMQILTRPTVRTLAISTPSLTLEMVLTTGPLLQCLRSTSLNKGKIAAH